MTNVKKQEIPPEFIKEIDTAVGKSPKIRDEYVAILNFYIGNGFEIIGVSQSGNGVEISSTSFLKNEVSIIEVAVSGPNIRLNFLRKKDIVAILINDNLVDIDATLIGTRSKISLSTDIKNREWFLSLAMEINNANKLS